MMDMLVLIDSPRHIDQITHPGMMTVKTRSMSLIMLMLAQTHTLNPALGLSRIQIIHHMDHTGDTTIIAHTTTMTMVTTTMVMTTTIIDTTTVLQNASVDVQVLLRKTV